jgi:hypothetical protein
VLACASQHSRQRVDAYPLCTGPCADHVRATLAWLETGGRANLNALARKYSLNDNIACLNEYREGCRR